MSYGERSVGRYEILDELGRGGMATVFLARQTDLDRLVALKELSAFRQTDATIARRFLRESRLVGSLNHPNIVTVHEYFEREGVPYIAMEYLARGSLRPRVPSVTLEQMAGILEGVLAALAYAEQRGIVHRDVKPENVMETAEGSVKLADFGIAKATGQASRDSFLTAAGSTVGTPSYMAPEQAMGRELGPWTDLYSVGVMTYEMVVGQVPFHDTEEPVAVLMRQVSDPIPPAIEVKPSVDPAISGWIERLLVKEPSDRIQSAQEAWDELEEVVLDLLGPRWRRSAILPALPAQVAAATRAVTPTGHRARSRSTTAGRVTMSGTGPGGTTGPRTRRAGTAGALAVAPTVLPRRAVPAPPVDDAPAGGSRPAAAVPAPAPRRRHRALLTLGLVLLAPLLALVSAMGGGAPTPTVPLRSGSAAGEPASAASPSSGTPLTGGDVGLTVPASWSPVDGVPDLGLPLAGAVAARSPDGAGVVEAGTMDARDAPGPALLPAALLTAGGQPAAAAPRRTAVTLGPDGRQAWRYWDLRLAGDHRRITVYVLPTSGGVATVACAASAAAAEAFAADCKAVAATLELRRSRGAQRSRPASEPVAAPAEDEEESAVGDSRSDDPSDDSEDP